MSGNPLAAEPQIALKQGFIYPCVTDALKMIANCAPYRLESYFLALPLQATSVQIDIGTLLIIMKSEMSLQTKGMLAFAMLIIYAAGLTVFVLDQKEALIHEVEQLRSVYEREGAVSQSDLATLRTLQNLRAQILVQSDDIDRAGLRDQLGLVRSLYEGLPMRYPGAETTLLSLQGALVGASLQPSGRGGDAGSPNRSDSPAAE
jgi:hypothetical protein